MSLTIMVQLWRFAPVCMKWKLSAFYSGSRLKHFNRHICHTSNHCLEAGAPLAHFSLFSSTFSSVLMLGSSATIHCHATKSKQNATLNVFNEKFSHRAFAQQRRPRRRRCDGAWCSGCGWLCLSFLCNFCLMLVLLLIRKLLHLFEMFSLAN